MEEEWDRRSADVSLDDFSRHVESHAVECDVVGREEEVYDDDDAANTCFNRQHGRK